MNWQSTTMGVAALAALGLAAVATRGAGAPAGGSCHLAGIPVPAFATLTLKPDRFRALHAAVAPRGPSERWAEIPWQTDLLAALAKAAREGKPLVMWVMDGHPLGCT
jgi:hypothetical protein